MEEVYQWLLDSPPWVAYRTRLDLLDEPETNHLVMTERQKLLAHPLIQGLMVDMAGWETSTFNGHKSSSALFHKLNFLADIGLRVDDPGMAAITDSILRHHSSEGPFQVLMTIPIAYGGTGETQFAWALCDAPLLVFALASLGLGDDSRVQAATAHLASLVRENGFPCAGSSELGKWRGPGRKADPCPFANLAMLKALSALPTWQDTPAAHLAAESLLYLWEHSRDEHPYMFFMGSDFRKLKAPLVWFDILHVAETLSLFPWLRADERLLQMVAVITAKADPAGRYTPESIWTAWSNWDFGQKKVPSPWLTFLILRLRRRMGL